MGGCQNCGPFLGTQNIRCRIITGTEKGTIILTTTHMGVMSKVAGLRFRFEDLGLSIDVCGVQGEIWRLPDDV